MGKKEKNSMKRNSIRWYSRAHVRPPGDSVCEAPRGLCMWSPQGFCMWGLQGPCMWGVHPLSELEVTYGRRYFMPLKIPTQVMGFRRLFGWDVPFQVFLCDLRLGHRCWFLHFLFPKWRGCPRKSPESAHPPRRQQEVADAMTEAEEQHALSGLAVSLLCCRRADHGIWPLR